MKKFALLGAAAAIVGSLGFATAAQAQIHAPSGTYTFEASRYSNTIEGAKAAAYQEAAKKMEAFSVKNVLACQLISESAKRSDMETFPVQYRWDVSRTYVCKSKSE